MFAKSGENGGCSKVVPSNKAIVSIVLMLTCGQALSSRKRALSIGKIWLIQTIISSARGVVVIVVGNEHGDTSSNPG